MRVLIALTLLLMIGSTAAVSQTISATKIALVNSSGSNYSLTGVNVPAGATVWVFAGSQGSCSGTYTVADVNAGDNAKWVQIGTNHSQSFICTMQFRAFNLTGNASDTITVTGTFGSGTIAVGAIVITGDGVLDNSQVGFAGSGASVSTSSSVTTTAAAVICAGVFDYYSDTMTAGTGFTIPASGTVAGGAIMYQVVSGSGSYATSMNITGTNYSNIDAAAFKASGGGGGGGTPVKRRQAL